MKLSKLLATMGVAALFVGLVAACSSDDSKPVGTSAADCKSACAKCGGGQTDCVSKCDAAVKSDCGKQYSAIISCSVANNCDANKCGTQTEAYMECVMGSGQGGSGQGGSGQGGSGQGGTGEGGTAGVGGGVAGQGGGTAGTGGGSTGDCKEFWQAGACGTCMESKCCAETAACKVDSACVACLQNQSCDPSTVPTANALAVCYQGSCGTECGGGGGSIDPACDAPAVAPSNGSCIAATPCNPVTNAGCDTAAGEACDFGEGTNGFQCYPAPNDGALCGACNAQAGQYCQGTMVCGGTKCARFCCNDGDCGTGKCDKTVTEAEVGLCVVQ
jgi:hypothetical protein